MATATTEVAAARQEVVVFYHLPNGEHIPGQEVRLHFAEVVHPERGNLVLVVFHDENEFRHAQRVMGWTAFRPLGGSWQTWLHRSQVEVVDPARKPDRRKRKRAR